MKTKFFFLLSIILFLTTLSATTTHREKQCENQNVIVWKTVIEPHQALIMHRHDHQRVVVALTDIDLLVKNDRGKSHHLIMKHGTARLLSPDHPQELHVDINNSNHSMKVMVIEFKK